jgi:hypothetical protein
MSFNKGPDQQERERGWAQRGKLPEVLVSGSMRYGNIEKADPDPQSTALVMSNGAAIARLVRDAGPGEGDKVEEIVVGVRPLLRGFRHGGNIRLCNTAKLFNCAALEVYVDSQRFTLYPGSDMEVRPSTTARMEVEPTARSTASVESVSCTFYGKPSRE